MRKANKFFYDKPFDPSEYVRVRGTSDHDKLYGDSQPNYIKGLCGNDVLYGDCFGDKGNLVINGGFEYFNDGTEGREYEGVSGTDYKDNGSWYNFDEAELAGHYDNVPGWYTMEGHSIEISVDDNADFYPYDGSAKAELDSHDDMASVTQTNTRLYQDVETHEGCDYELTFYYAPRVNHEASSSVNVLWGDEEILSIQNNGLDDVAWTEVNNGAVLVEQIAVESLNGESDKWYKVTLQVEADSDLTRLEFQGSGQEDTLGMYLDNVSLYKIESDDVLVGGYGRDKLMGMGDNGEIIWDFDQYDTMAVENGDILYGDNVSPAGGRCHGKDKFIYQTYTDNESGEWVDDGVDIVMDFQFRKDKLIIRTDGEALDDVDDLYITEVFSNYDRYGRDNNDVDTLVTFDEHEGGILLVGVDADKLNAGNLKVKVINDLGEDDFFG